jgi:dipeptidyl aminopeptidase/acylaminoacyl peptidase
LHTKHFSAAIAVAAGLALQPALANPPVEAFGNLPQMSEPKLAPDGKHFAALQSLNGKPAVLIYEVNAPKGSKPVVVPSTDAVVDAFDWANSDRLVVRLKMTFKRVDDNRTRAWVRTLSVKADGSGAVLLLKNNPTFQFNTYTSYIVSKDVDDPQNVYIPIFVRNISFRMHYEFKDPNEDWRLDLYKVNLDTGEGHTFQTGNYQTWDWIMDGHGHLAARVDLTPYTDKRDTLKQQLYAYDNGKWLAPREFDATGDNGVNDLGLTDDGKSMVVWRHNGEGPTALMRHDLKTGDEGQVLWSNPNYDVIASIHDEWTGRVIGAVYADDHPQYVYFDDARAGLQAGLQQAFAGLNTHIVSMDRDMDKVIVAVDGPRHPLSYYFLDRTTHAASEILSGYPGLSENDLGEMKPYPYTARDGLKIPAYLTLPPGKSAKDLPVVVLPHAGPDNRDAIGFDWWAQFLANRGYAVLQPNYRGSYGYGRKFTEAGLHQWGLKMQDDITDGVKQLVADGIADPKRVCIVGADYGGYAALAGAAFTPDLYACAASINGISDLNEFVFSKRSDYGKDSRTLSFWFSRVGNDFDDNTRLKETSPALHADRVKAPVLLIHDQDDTTVRVNQSERMAAALTDAHKDVKFVRLEGNDHRMMFTASRVRMLTELEAFLKKNIGN